MAGATERAAHPVEGVTDLAAPDARVDVNPTVTDRRGMAARPQWWRELMLIGFVYLLYSLIRNAAPTRVGLAVQNAHDVLGLERILNLDIERGINAAVASVSAIAVPANYYYSTLHFLVTGAVLGWLYATRPQIYRTARSVLLGMTLVALVGYWQFPLAPPRLTPGEGFVDTVRYFGIWGLTPGQAATSVSNQYAAMPSMHVGWALWAGLAVICCSRKTPVRILAGLYPVMTLFVVVATANHYVLDAVGALGAFGLGVAGTAIAAKVSGRALVMADAAEPAPQVAAEPTG